MIQIRKEIKDLKAEVTTHRRQLHQIPEIGLDTVKTKAYIIQALQQIGSLKIEEGYAENGVVAYLHVGEDFPSIGFRCDMDALPILEENEVSFISKHEGCSHACGHDGHMAAILGSISYFVKHVDALTCNLVFIFQPGEEGPGGAKLMIRDGLFEKYPMRYVIGTHLMNDVEKGKIACCAGPIMARNGEFVVDIHGVSAHGAQAYEGRDAIVGAAALITQLQSIVSRSIDPLRSTVISVGKIHGGQARNQISDHVHMLGTIRSFHDDSYELMKKRMQEVCDGVGLSYGVDVKLSIEDYYYAVENDAYLNAVLQEALGEDFIQQVPKMTAEDFSYYQKEVPGLFYFTGVGDAQHTNNIHNCRFNFDEEALLNSVECNVRILEKLGVYHD